MSDPREPLPDWLSQAAQTTPAPGDTPVRRQKPVTTPVFERNPDNGRLERLAMWLQASRESVDEWRIVAGIHVAQSEHKYGAGVVDTLARDAGMGRSTLYEYAAIARFLVSWLGFSARRTIELYPFLTYTHLRAAQRLPFEDAIEALLAVDVGDPEHPEFDKLPMTPDTFRLYVGALQGKPVPELPLFDLSGQGHEVLPELSRRWREWATRRIRIIVREVK